MTPDELALYLGRADLLNVKLSDDRIIRGRIESVDAGTITVVGLDGLTQMFAPADVVTVVEA